MPELHTFSWELRFLKDFHLASRESIQVWDTHHQHCVGLKWVFSLRKDGGIPGFSLNILIHSVLQGQCCNLLPEPYIRWMCITSVFLCCGRTLRGFCSFILPFEIQLLVLQFHCSFFGAESFISQSSLGMSTINKLDLNCLIASPLSMHSIIAWLPHLSIITEASKICFNGVTPTQCNFPFIFTIPSLFEYDRDTQGLKFISVSFQVIVHL